MEKGRLEVLKEHDSSYRHIVPYWGMWTFIQTVSVQNTACDMEKKTNLHGTYLCHTTTRRQIKGLIPFPKLSLTRKIAREIKENEGRKS